MTEQVENVVFIPFRVLAWVVALPIQGLAWMINWVRARTYDPEQLICPACGFRGDSGTNGKTCTIRFTRTIGNEKAAIQHTCLRCGCDEIFTSLFVPASKRWLPEFKADHVAKIKEAKAKEAL